MVNFFTEINGFYNNNNNINYGDTDSLYIGKKYWDASDEANLVDKNLCQRKNNYKSGGIFTVCF